MFKTRLFYRTSQTDCRFLIIIKGFFLFYNPCIERRFKYNDVNLDSNIVILITMPVRGRPQIM